MSKTAKTIEITNSPKNNGQKSDGTFASGNAIGGKTKGARHKATMELKSFWMVKTS
jgi:hypothetical protein